MASRSGGRCVTYARSGIRARAFGKARAARRAHLRAAPRKVQLLLERVARELRVIEEGLLDVGHRSARHQPEGVHVGRHLAPANQLEPAKRRMGTQRQRLAARKSVQRWRCATLLPVRTGKGCEVVKAQWQSIRAFETESSIRKSHFRITQKLRKDRLTPAQRTWRQNHRVETRATCVRSIRQQRTDLGRERTRKYISEESGKTLHVCGKVVKRQPHSHPCFAADSTMILFDTSMSSSSC
eukprot:6202962-Pleurochrysis_carterae.AAC.1